MSKRFRTLPFAGVVLLSCGSDFELAGRVSWRPALGRGVDNRRSSRAFVSRPRRPGPGAIGTGSATTSRRKGITRDLEAMARVGIGEALIGNVFFDDTRAGDIKVLSEPWWELVEHAIREGGRVGVNIALFNCPGWSQSGGPWIKPQQAMRYLVSSETRVHGSGRIPATAARAAATVPGRGGPGVSGPARRCRNTRAARSPQVSCTPTAPGMEKAVDGQADTAWAFPAGAGQGEQPLTIEITVAEPLTARHVALVPGESAWAAQCELQAADDAGTFHSVRRFAFDRSNMAVNVGPLPRGPVTVSFAPVDGAPISACVDGRDRGRRTGRNLVVTRCTRGIVRRKTTRQDAPDSVTDVGHVSLASTTRTGSTDVVDPTHAGPRPDEATAARWHAAVGCPARRLGRAAHGHDDDRHPQFARFAGRLRSGSGQDEPAGSASCISTPSSASSCGGCRPSDRSAWKHVVADSYEMGSQNWTDDLAPMFRDRYGYDPLPWLPVLTGRVVGSADQSNRFLWDLRRLVADRIATEYVGGLRDLCRPHGLQLWLENYGHWGFPAEFLQYGGQSDCIGGEFWVTGGLGADRMSCGLVGGQHLRLPSRVGGSVHGRSAVPNRTFRHESPRRLGFLRGHQSLRAARLRPPAVGRSPTGRQRVVWHGVQPAQHLVQRQPGLDQLSPPLLFSAAAGHARGGRRLLHR